MGDNIWLGDRDGVRTPMQWTPDRNAGFSTSDPGRLYLPTIMDPVYGYQVTNVEAQMSNAVLAAALDPADDRGPQAEPRLRPRLRTPNSPSTNPARARLPAGADERRPRAVREQLLPLRPADRARPARSSTGAEPVELIGGVRFPAIGELPVPADPRRPRLLLVPAAQGRAPSWCGRPVRADRLAAAAGPARPRTVPAASPPGTETSGHGARRSSLGRPDRSRAVRAALRGGSVPESEDRARPAVSVTRSGPAHVDPPDIQHPTRPARPALSAIRDTLRIVCVLPGERTRCACPDGCIRPGVAARDQPGLLPARSLHCCRWLPRQRWFAGKGRPITAFPLVAATELLPPERPTGPLGSCCIC